MVVMCNINDNDNEIINNVNNNEEIIIIWNNENE